MAKCRESLEAEKKAALLTSMRATSKLPGEEEAAKNCADVQAACRAASTVTLPG